MFSQTVEYILRVVVFLASQKSIPATTQQISEATQAPMGYLAKIMQRLVKARIATSQRGRNGGFLLSNEAYKMNLLDIIQQVEPLVRIQACPLARKEHNQNLCPLHKRLDQAVAAVENTLREATIESLIEQLKTCEVGAALLSPESALNPEFSTKASA